MKIFILGTRGSPLALWQAHHVTEQLKKINSSISIEIKKIKTSGDAATEPLYNIGGKALFIKELEEALLRNEIDFAVHSLKDVPADLPEGLTLAATLKREDPRDVLVSKKYKSISELPDGTVIGTSSLRRQAQLLSMNPKLKFVPLRGNVGTRIQKINDGECEATLLAAAGMIRLGVEEHIKEYIAVNKMIPAVGQGVIALEVRQADQATIDLVSALSDKASQDACLAERSFLKLLDGGCKTPIAAHATVDDGILTLQALIASPNGEEVVRSKLSGASSDAAFIGIKLAEDLLRSGGKEILSAFRN